MIICILGAPGSGKGTQASLISKRFNLKHISIGEFIRNSKEQDVMPMKSYALKGLLVPDFMMIPFVTKLLSKEENNYIIDGYPRTIRQGEAFFNTITDFNSTNNFLLFIDVSKEILEKRNLGRIFCEKCKKDFNLFFDPPIIEGLCDYCSGNLIKRDDCYSEIIKTRLDYFYEETLPMIQNNINVIRINGELSIDEIHNEIINKLKIRQ